MKILRFFQRNLLELAFIFYVLGIYSLSITIIDLTSSLVIALLFALSVAALKAVISHLWHKWMQAKETEVEMVNISKKAKGIVVVLLLLGLVYARATMFVQESAPNPIYPIYHLARESIIDVITATQPIVWATFWPFYGLYVIPDRESDEWQWYTVITFGFPLGVWASMLYQYYTAKAILVLLRRRSLKQDKALPIYRPF